ncbi:hypothetical protein M514_11734 [Trichuris suis]|uniref:DUF5641 domain-containing protein n=1 Tax=Trichuris suis TaxID=68888 RepID=A0A085MVZ8_9BILA|nr:hypothetical protein M513_11734 [Trichuris suis]KFD61394.1 hypothetical protein M514_11734 [Trichuris suis]
MEFLAPCGTEFGRSLRTTGSLCKGSSSQILNGGAVTDEVLFTVVVEVESLMNSRPLTHVSLDPRDPEPLTPNHFLLGRAHPHIPPDIITEVEISSRRKWRCAQAMAEAFWKRWLREYVPSLIERRKWLRPTCNLNAGDLVLVVYHQSPRGHWPLGTLIECKPGADGVVRVAKITTRHGTYLRPVVKLCLFETHKTDVSEQTSINMGQLCKGDNDQKDMSGLDGEGSHGRDTSPGSDSAPVDPLTRSSADQTVTFVSATDDCGNPGSC